MFSVSLVSFSVLICLPFMRAYLYCGNFGGYGEYCSPRSYQEAYCCDYDYNTCCYRTDVAAIWWFWVLMILFIVFISTLIAICCRRRRMQRVGYVVVRGQNVVPRAVITTNQTQIAQVAPPGTIYHPYHGPPAYQGYHDPHHGGGSAYGQPPPYAPPTAPQTTHK